MTTSNNMQAANEMFTAFLSDNDLDVKTEAVAVKEVSFLERYYGAGVGASVLRSTPTHVHVG